MPAIKIKPKSQQKIAFPSEVKAPLVVVVVEGEEVTVYTGKEAEDKLND